MKPRYGDTLLLIVQYDAVAMLSADTAGSILMTMHLRRSCVLPVFAITLLLWIRKCDVCTAAMPVRAELLHLPDDGVAGVRSG